MSLDRRHAALSAMRGLIERGANLVATAFEEDDTQRRYREHFLEEAAAPATEALTLDALAKRIAQEEILLAGAYHTAPEVPRALTRLLEKLPEPEGLEVLLLPIARHDECGAFFAEYHQGKLDLEELFEVLDDISEWPVDRSDFRPLLELAQSRGALILGAGTPEKTGPMAQAEADARVLRDAGEFGRAFVVVGEFHLGSGHLPKALSRALGRDVSGCPRLVHTAWTSFLEWEAQGDAPAAAVLSSGMIGVYAAAPYRLFESFQSWLHEA